MTTNLAPDLCLGIVGMGYVGLPLAVEFGKHLTTVGFDINSKRIDQLRQHIDKTQEVTAAELQQASKLQLSTEADDLHDCTVFIVTVPTPIDVYRRPDLSALTGATRTIAAYLKQGDVVIYESTVYPGATEEVCVPILQQLSGLTHNRDFFTGYSPERINPGDKTHRLSQIKKVTSGSTPETAEFVDALYRSIISAGTYKASSIKVAEAAKVIENTQRDLNIALINELAILFNRLGIDTDEVLSAAATKWNFLPFRPGLVGGHCIGVDPYYLTHKAQEIGHHPEIILAGRRINDSMGEYVAAQVIKLMVKKELRVCGSKALVMGMTFKENCPDLRNTRVVDIIKHLTEYGIQVDIYDPWADADEVAQEYQLTLCDKIPPHHYDAIILAVAHQQFKAMSASEIRGWGKPDAVLYDVKSILPLTQVDGRL